MVRAKSVIFNIPVRPMERLLQASNISVTLSPQNSAVIQSVYPLVATKLYAYYGACNRASCA